MATKSETPFTWWIWPNILAQKTKILIKADTFQRMNCVDIFIFIGDIAAIGPKCTASGPETAQLKYPLLLDLPYVSIGVQIVCIRLLCPQIPEIITSSS